MKLIIIFLLSLSISEVLATETFKIRELKSTEYKSIKDFVKTDLVVIVAYGNYCPILRRHVPTLNEMEKTYKDKVTFIMLNSIKDISDVELEQESKEFQLNSPIYQDQKLETVKALGLSTLSEVALLRISTGKVLYLGAINNQFSFDLLRQKPTENYLIDAINSSFKNEVVKKKKAKVFGCAISF